MSATKAGKKTVEWVLLNNAGSEVHRFAKKNIAMAAAKEIGGVVVKSTSR